MYPGRSMDKNHPGGVESLRDIGSSVFGVTDFSRSARNLGISFAVSDAAAVCGLVVKG